MEGEEERKRSWENALADAVPVSPFFTGSIIAALFFASYLLTAFLSGGEIVVVHGDGVSLSRDAWAALALALFWFAIVGIGRYTAIANLRDAHSLAGLVPRITMEKVDRYARGVTPRELAHSRWAGLAGLFLGGILYTVAVLGIWRLGWAAFENPVDVWMMLMVSLLGMQLLRRVYFLRGDTGLFADAVKGFEPDLSDISRLDVFGRVALRGALPWFVASGILALLLVGQDAAGVTAPALILTLAAAFFTFFRPMLRAHGVIHRAKQRDLGKLRGRIRHHEKALHGGGEAAREAAAMLPALIALETRLEHVREWPLDLQTAGRLILYTAIPLGSWFGGSVVNIALEALIS